MKDLINGHYLANLIRMRRNNYSGTFIIVEGLSDKRVYQNLVDQSNCEFVIAERKEKAVDAIKILDQDSCQGVLGIVDADFFRLENQLPSSPNLLLTRELRLAYEISFFINTQLHLSIKQWEQDNSDYIVMKND